MRVVGLDHVVLRVSDTERSVAWYRDKLGLEPVRLEEWRKGEVFFPSVRVSPEVILDLFPADGPVHPIDHVCLVVEPTDLQALAASGSFDVVATAEVNFGAQGDAPVALYVRDPDGHVIELRHYSPIIGPRSRRQGE